MPALTAHWQALYGASGCNGLPETAPLVEGLLQQLQGGSDSQPEGKSSAAITVEEVEAAVRRLRYGRPVGPDGLRGEFLKGLYVRREFWCEEKQCMCVVHEHVRSAPRPGHEVPQGGWQYPGQEVPLFSEFWYLGIVFHQTRGMSACVSALQSAGLRVMWGMLQHTMLSRCGTTVIGSVEVQAQLFDALMAPIHGYCSEVWPAAQHLSPTLVARGGLRFCCANVVSVELAQ